MGEVQRVSTVGHDVRVSLSGLDFDAQQRVRFALHRADRRLGVISSGHELVLLTWEADPQDAHGYARRLLTSVAQDAGVSEEDLARAAITEVTQRERNITGRPRRVGLLADGYRAVDLGARGQLRVLHEGPTGDWIVELNTEGAWAGRDLRSVLHEVFALPWGGSDDCVRALIFDLAGHRTSDGVRFPCACCDSLTLSEPPPGSFAICPVCRWEDDDLQFRDIDYRGGANRPSLREARANVQRCGRSDPSRA
jgi:hypothetical protein